LYENKNIRFIIEGIISEIFAQTYGYFTFRNLQEAVITVKKIYPVTSIHPIPDSPIYAKPKD